MKIDGLQIFLFGMIVGAGWHVGQLIVELVGRFIKGLNE